MPLVEKLTELKGHSGAIYSLSKGLTTNGVFSASGDKMLAHWDLDSFQFSGFSVKLEFLFYTFFFCLDTGLMCSVH